MGVYILISKWRRLKWSIGLCVFFFVQSVFANDYVAINIEKANVEPVKIAILDFFSETGQLSPYGSDIREIVVNDLVSTHLFEAVSKRTYAQNNLSFLEEVNFAEWKKKGVQFVVQSEIFLLEDGKIQISFIVWDIFVQGGERKTFSVSGFPQHNLRKIAHQMADDVYEYAMGEEGHFNTRIAYVAETGPVLKRVRRLAVMDYDGHNNFYYTKGDQLVLTPRFSVDGKQLIYLSYVTGRPEIFFVDLETNQHRVMGAYVGMTFSPRFSPPGNSIIFSQAIKGNSEIYSLNLETNRTIRLTNSLGIDVSPSYSPSGNLIVFNSDRSGTSQLYLMDRAGGRVSRITYNEGRYTTPIWSPRGDYIAFTKILGNRFYVGIIKPNGMGERLLAEGYYLEASSWSPNGRYVLYTGQTRSGKNADPQLYMVDITGRHTKKLATDTLASDPDWSKK